MFDRIFPQQLPCYTVTLYDLAGAVITTVEHTTLARAAQHAKTAVIDACGPHRAVVRDSAGKWMWEAERDVLADTAGWERPKHWFDANRNGFSGDGFCGDDT